MRSETCHRIRSLTTNVTVAPMEAVVWNNTMLEVAKMKIKVAEGQRTVNMMQKLRKKGLGTNQVEQFARRDMGRGKGAERRRKAVIRALMRAKVEDAMTSLALARGKSNSREAYLTRRWGHHGGVMSAFKVICQEQVEEAWREKGDKCMRKLQHLEMKWKREERRRTPKLDIGGEWRGVKIGDKELEEEEERQE